MKNPAGHESAAAPPARIRTLVPRQLGLSLVLFLFLGTWCAPSCSGYSVLSHEAIVDAAWKDYIAPALMQRFPATTPDELLQAYAYAYGGSIIQDLGYYPFGSKLFSDLTHYVRTGDFVLALLDESTNLNEYAFALGALSHYASDIYGHSLATNLSVPLTYSKLQRKFGTVVTYEQNPSAHSNVEFAFDVDQVAEGNYAPHAYHQFIGFEVSKPLLDRAFLDTYSIPMSDIFRNENRSISTYRRSVSVVIPRATKVAWHLHRREITNSYPSETRKKYIYNVTSSEYKKDWGGIYEKPSIIARIKAFFLLLMPKVGLFKSFRFRSPSPAVEQLYMHSFNEALDRYREMLTAQKDGTLQLPDENFDTGDLTAPGAYGLADKTYAALLDRVYAKPIPAPLRDNILAFYADLGKPISTRNDPKAWNKVLTELETLKATPPAAPAVPATP